MTVTTDAAAGEAVAGTVAPVEQEQASLDATSQATDHAEDAESEAEAELEANEGQEGDSSPPDKPKGGFQRRISELTNNWRSAERDRDYWRDLAMRHMQPQAQEKPEEPEAPKSLQDFDYDESRYQAYLFEQAEQRAIAAAEARLSENMQRQRAAARASQYQQREAEFAKTTPDYASVAHRPDLPITAPMAEVIMESDEGPALAYFLGKNPEIARTIANLPAHIAAKELGRIEGRLVAERESAKPKTVSKTPPPPKKIEGAHAPIEKDPDKMSADEWVKWREKQLAKK